MQLFASPATWALFMAHATYNFVRYTIEQEMPKFFNDVLHTGHAKTGMALVRWRQTKRVLNQGLAFFRFCIAPFCLPFFAVF